MGKSTEGLSRRSFLGVGAAALGAAAIGGMAGCSSGDGGSAGSAGSTAAAAEYLPANWDGETDILVVGCGGAGIAAGITAASENLGECLILEAAPEGEEGGNTRVSAQVIFCPKSVEGAIKYQTNLNGPYAIEDDLMQAWAENICENIDWLDSVGIIAEETKFFNPEWPDVEGSDECNCYLVGGEMGKELLWEELARVAEEQGVTIQHDTRVTELVFDPDTKEVFGVKAELADGGEKYYKANKGVILACGGFENNPDMIAKYNQIGYYETRPMGTPYNRGDGINMALSINADLWHMNNFANSGYGILCGDEDNPCSSPTAFRTKDYIFVGSDGARFMYEECTGLARHGKYLFGGTTTNLAQPVPTYAIFGQGCFDAGPIIEPEFFCTWNTLMGLLVGETNQDYLDAGIIQKGDTVEELAEKLGLDPATLASTVSTYNTNAAAGSDPEFRRGTDVYSAFNYGAQGEAASRGETTIDNSNTMKPSISAFDLVPLEGPFYGVRLYTETLNTQGGAKRSAKGEVMDVHGNPIPRLYGAGEFGPIYSYNYNGGGNVSEAMSSGRLAARQAAALEAWQA